jgi:hypothetical protein
MPLGERDSCGSVEAAPSSISRPIRGDYAGFGPNSRAWGQAKRAPAPARCALISIRTGDSRGAGPAAGTPAGPALHGDHRPWEHSLVTSAPGGDEAAPRQSRTEHARPVSETSLAGGVRKRDRDRAPSGVATVGDADLRGRAGGPGTEMSPSPIGGSATRRHRRRARPPCVFRGCLGQRVTKPSSSAGSRTRTRRPATPPTRR